MSPELIDLKLAYIIQPDPNPIRASAPTGNPRQINLQVVIGKRYDASVSATDILITFPVGKDDSTSVLSMSLGSLVLHTPGPWKVGLTDDGTGVEIKQPQGAPKLDNGPVAPPP